MRYLITALAAVQGAYMIVDGARAIFVGNYITPSSGQHAGQLGPWASLVEALGLSPDMLGVKLAFVVLGLAWLTAGIAVAIPISWGWTTMLVVAVASLWYAIPGTLISITVLALLFLPSVRQAF
ncbi:MAG: hypothetical protein M3O70_02755 [Actinomycetota bacterium]|nr:hypothetical protein [Actinomycetota bacterium]